MNFQTRLIGNHVYLLQSHAAGGISQWHYIAVVAHKEMLFIKAAQQNAGFDCANFGSILASGMGEGPPTHVQWELEA